MTATVVSPAHQGEERLFRSVFGAIPSGVTILTTTTPEGPAGVTASAVCPLSLRPRLAHTINAIEGRWGDVLGLRGTMGVRRWPCADNWLERVLLRARIRRSPPIRRLAGPQPRRQHGRGADTAVTGSGDIRLLR